MQRIQIRPLTGAVNLPLNIAALGQREGWREHWGEDGGVRVCGGGGTGCRQTMEMRYTIFCTTANTVAKSTHTHVCREVC